VYFRAELSDKRANAAFKRSASFKERGSARRTSSIKAGNVPDG